MGGYLRRLKAKLDPAGAITAMARGKWDLSGRPPTPNGNSGGSVKLGNQARRAGLRTIAGAKNLRASNSSKRRDALAIHTIAET
jgi:hypothetical protein